MSRTTPGPHPREDAALGSLMLAFDGLELPPGMAARLGDAPAAGITLFRNLNVREPGQVRELTSSIQRAARDTLLIAADQEGGQLLALGDGPTAFAGNMAVGAVGDEVLAEQVGAATGRELRAMGVTVAYAPVCDVASNPANPALGIRSFGDDPPAVARLAAATVRGLLAGGVAPTAKHFPGLGDLGADSHHELASVGEPADRERFERLELVPFRAAIDAGARLVMSAHIAAPALTGAPQVPATLSRRVMTDLLRDDLGFRGLSVTDALDMAALAQGPGQIVDVLAAVGAGVDLLLTTPDGEARLRIETGLRQAARRKLLDRQATMTTLERLAALRSWLSTIPQPDLAVVGSAAHRALARRLAERSVTLVRDDAGLVPIRLPSDASIAVLQPQPVDLTPADTSSHVGPTLAAAIAARHPRVTSFVTGHAPDDAEIAALREAVAGHDLLVIGTISASLEPAQARLVRELLATGMATITVALRTPWDLLAYPSAATHACSYGILPTTVDALVDALFGRIGFSGRLPVTVGDLYPRGHGLVA
jgi:beta-N-acetylhexosaminidase